MENITDWALKQFTAHYQGASAEPSPLPPPKGRGSKTGRAAGIITLDTETTLRGTPPEAWAYKLGNRSAIDWVLDQYKKKKAERPDHP